MNIDVIVSIAFSVGKALDLAALARVTAPKIRTWYNLPGKCCIGVNEEYLAEDISQ